ncbi:MAG: ATPase, T2SS/T4P/T4SS family, partial [Sulfuricurvum sp.]|nr:ATPase, T2SS/T4P/T4SS family [Sulfuricurvum sp.]
FILSYDDYSIMDERVSHSVLSGSDKEKITVDFTFENMARDAANQGASDIHIIPKEKFYYVFFRKNGDLIEQEKYLLDIERGFDFVTLIKLDASATSKGGFKADKHIAPQDARVVYGDIDLRLVFIPDGLNGQRMAVIARVIKKTIIRDPDLKAKGFHDPIITAINRTSRLEGGFIILSGITGSGKSTLLADILATIDKRRRVLTIEDPIEYVLSGKNITQHQLYIPPDEEDKDRMGYLEFTKAAKRADPNVLSIGEMRKNPDLIDAVSEMVYAGQLVYTTIHIQSCFKVVHAMEHVFKMNRESVVPSIFLSINMKLTKRLCDHCKNEDTEKNNISRLNELKPKFRYESKESLDEFLSSKDSYVTYLHNPEGCPKCGYTGYSGRVPMYEYFEPSVELIDFILKSNPTNYDIEKYVCSRNLGQNRLDTYIQRLIDGEVDTSQVILDSIL